MQGDQGFLATAVLEAWADERVAVLRHGLGVRAPRHHIIGLLIAGAFDAWVPNAWLQAVFFEGHPTLAFIIDPIIGPVLAMVSFVCSVGNVPLAAVLCERRISFGGVISFIFADLIIIPIIVIYRKYYGWKAALRITGIFYGAMVLAGYAVELLFTPAKPDPDESASEHRDDLDQLELHDLAQHRVPV